MPRCPVRALRALTSARLALAAGLTAGSLTVVVAAPAHAVPDLCDGIEADLPRGDVEEVDEPGPPIDALQVRAAQQKATELSGRQPGEGVVVAVLDSGVVDDPVIPQDDVPATQPALEYFHGSAVAGLVNGAPLGADEPVGIAPAARVVDVRVYDVGPDAGDDDSDEVSADRVAEGLTAIQPRIESGEIDIVTVALRVGDNANLRAAVRRATGAGAIVVASSGNRGEDDAYEAGEDYADEVFPAGYVDDPLVVAASTVPPAGEAAIDHIVQSSAIDVAVPTSEAITYALNGAACSMGAASTSAAAGEVAGVLALLMSVHDDESPREIVRRLEETATGSSLDDPDRPDKLVGHGVVQPLEALTRTPVPSGATSGRPGMDAEPATLPEPEPDVLESTRRNALWWGLVGGGALVVAVLLRPVLSRRR